VAGEDKNKSANNQAPKIKDRSLFRAALSVQVKRCNFTLLCLPDERNGVGLFPRCIHNFKRQVSLLNIYRDLDHLAEVFQRKMVLAICNPGMLKDRPDKIMGRLTRLPPELFPPEAMKVLRRMIRERGTESRFTAADVLTLLASYPPPESDEELRPSGTRVNDAGGASGKK